MPCYTEWDAYLEEGSKEYADTRARLEAKLKAVRHIVDYYYGSAGLSVPPARWSGSQAFMQLAHNEFSIDDAALDGRDEQPILEAITHHCACDEIHFTLLYDLVSLLDLKNAEDAGYARVMMHSANILRRKWR